MLWEGKVITPRLIDADALLAYIDVGHLRPPTEICFSELDVKNIVDKSPTIDAVPVVRGEWLFGDPYPHRVYCSVCYKTNIYNAEILEGKEYPRFCMWCGAQMEDKPCE